MNKQVIVTVADNDNPQYKKVVTIELNELDHAILKNCLMDDERTYDRAYNRLCHKIESTVDGLPYCWYIDCIKYRG